MNDILDRALEYAARGWGVFPCDPATKRPLTRHGLKDATTDAAQIEQWFDKDPAPMIGLPTGANIGAFVIDLDPSESQTAEGLYDRIIEITRAVVKRESLAICETPRGGWHIYFKLPDAGDELVIGNRAGVIAGVDVRGEGGYVIAPPSVRDDGRFYDWLGKQTNPTPAPYKLLEFVLNYRENKDGEAVRVDADEFTLEDMPTPDGDLFVNPDAAKRFAANALEGELQKIRTAPEGTRNRTIHGAAIAIGSLLPLGLLDANEVLNRFQDAAAGYIKADGFPAFIKTYRSGIQYGINNPRDPSTIGSLRARSTYSNPAAPLGPPPVEGDEGDSSQGREYREPVDSDQDLAAECAELPLNDLGNARRLMKWYPDEAFYVQDVGWHYWTGTHYKAKAGEAGVRRMVYTLQDIVTQEVDYIEPSESQALVIEAAKANPNVVPEAEKIKKLISDVRQKRRDYAVRCGNSGKTDSAIKQLQALTVIEPDELDSNELQINVLNGTLVAYPVEDLENPDPSAKRYKYKIKLKPHDKADRISKMLPAEYDPDARCPKWKEFLDMVMPDLAKRDFVKRYHGCALSGIKEQYFLFNYGRGANGKSAFMECLCEVYGPDYSRTLSQETITGDAQRGGHQASPELARLAGARFVRVSEFADSQNIKEETIKLLTGSEAFSVRHLQKDLFDIVPKWKTSGSGNSKPNIKGVDEGIWRRMILLEWADSIPEEKQRNFNEVMDEFKAERSGILNWLLSGLVDYLNNGLAIPDIIKSDTADYRAEQDIVQAFLDACITFSEPDDRIQAKDMFDEFDCYLELNGHNRWTANTFGKKMREKGLGSVKRRLNYYMGMKFKFRPTDEKRQNEYAG